MVITKELAVKCMGLTNKDIDDQLQCVVNYLLNDEITKITDVISDKDLYKIQGKITVLRELKDLRQRIKDATSTDRL